MNSTQQSAKKGTIKSSWPEKELRIREYKKDIFRFVIAFSLSALAHSGHRINSCWNFSFTSTSIGLRESLHGLRPALNAITISPLFTDSDIDFLYFYSIIYKVFITEGRMNIGNDQRLLLNTYLEKLTLGWDEEAAREVVQAFRELPSDESCYEHVGISESDSSFMGHTNEAGNIGIDDKDMKITRRGGPPEKAVARVGRFKITRKNYKAYNLIYFKDFWKSDLATTASTNDSPPSWVLEFDMRSGKPYALILRELVVVDPGEAFFKAAGLNSKLFVGMFVLRSLWNKVFSRYAYVSEFSIPRYSIIHGKSLFLGR